jgi:DNA adenine methylase
LSKQPSRQEIINDIDLDLISVWHAIKDMPDDFIKTLNKWTYSEESFIRAKEIQPSDLIERAVKEYVLRRMSRGGMKKAFAWSKRLRGGKPGDVNAWETMLKVLPQIHDRINKVTILNHSWEVPLSLYYQPSDFLYLDPPYVKGTRSKGATHVYEHEMNDKDHEKLLDSCLLSDAKIMISGYQCPLYTSRLKRWNFHYKPIANHSSQSDRKAIKLECIWTNY